jgi:hypothetical protein
VVYSAVHAGFAVAKDICLIARCSGRAVEDRDRGEPAIEIGLAAAYSL